MNNQGSECREWEKVFFVQSRDAAVGRFFKGMIHNMNGDIQALSMQAELFAMAFEQLSAMLSKAIEAKAPEDVCRELEEMGDLLRRRASLLPQMQQAVRSLKETVRGTVNFGESLGISDKEDGCLNAIIRSEEKFFCADAFFKHKVVRDLILADALPPVPSYQAELRYVVYVLLANALEALKKKPEPPWSLQITTRLAGDGIEIIVQDNGIGIAPDVQGHIFEPFFSTWPVGSGLGLYLARQLVIKMSGRISFESVSGRTRFFVSVPADRI